MKKERGQLGATFKVVGLEEAEVTPRGRTIVEQAVVALATLGREEVPVALEPVLQRPKLILIN